MGSHVLGVDAAKVGHDNPVTTQLREEIANGWSCERCLQPPQSLARRQQLRCERSERSVSMVQGMPGLGVILGQLNVKRGQFCAKSVRPSPVLIRQWGQKHKCCNHASQHYVRDPFGSWATWSA